MAWAETNEPQSQKNVCIANAWSAVTGLWCGVGCVIQWCGLVIYNGVGCMRQWCGLVGVTQWCGWCDNKMGSLCLLAASLPNHIICNARKMPGHCSHWWLGALYPMGDSFYERVIHLQSTPLCTMNTGWVTWVGTSFIKVTIPTGWVTGIEGYCTIPTGWFLLKGDSVPQRRLSSNVFNRVILCSLSAVT